MKLSAAMAPLALLASTASFAAPPAPAKPPENNVLLIMLDGVRWEEVFRGVDPGQSVDTNPTIFSFLTGPLTHQGVLYGNHDRGETVRVANPHLNSLPAYQSIFAGATQRCGSNNCGRIPVETFPERILHDLNLKPEQVATFASWVKIANAVEHVEGTTLVNAGNRPYLPAGQAPDAETAQTNAQQAQDTPPWGDARLDKYTVAHALHFLKTQKPRFLYVSLDDSDEWGHLHKYDNYVATLRQQDGWIHDFITTLDGMDDYGKHTTVIVTTDHGRGEGNDWGDHGTGYPDAANIWIYLRSPATVAAAPTPPRASGANVNYTHLDIRPTIETVFGLEPKLDGVSPLPGHVISAVWGGKPGAATAQSTPSRKRSTASR